MVVVTDEQALERIESDAAGVIISSKTLSVSNEKPVSLSFCRSAKPKEQLPFHKGFRVMNRR